MKTITLILLTISLQANMTHVPHCVQSKGVVHVFTSPISEKANDEKDITIECIKADDVKEIKGIK